MRTLIRVISIIGAVLPAVLLGEGKTVLAVGAHAGDMELTAGAILAKHRLMGDRVVLLHLSLGESGNPKMTAEAYGAQKRSEAEAAAKALGAEVIFGPYLDGRVPPAGDEKGADWLAAQILKIQPSLVITHWKNSIHKDHSAAHGLTNDAVLLASLGGARVRGVYYAENWEDKEAFQPYVYVDVGGLAVEKWRECVNRYEFVRGGISPFAYLDYYEGLLKVRGAEARKKAAVALDIDPLGKKRVVDGL